MTYKQIYNQMITLIQQDNDTIFDVICNEVSATLLAETFLNDNTVEDEEQVFDIAVDVAEWYEKGNVAGGKVNYKTTT